MTGPHSVVVEADGGSRGNPGPAAYGAVLRDAVTGRVLAEEAATIGVATNNVAEYSGLIAGLRLAERFAPGAALEVRMDSRLVVEQMSGRWKIRHPAMRPLAVQANRLAPAGTRYTWIPREQNRYADRLANEALDGKRSGVTVGTEPGGDPAPAVEAAAAAEAAPAAEPAPDVEDVGTPADLPAAGQRGWHPPGRPPTTLVLVRHGVTEHTLGKRFSGGLASSNPGLSEEGRAQVRATADWLKPLAGDVDALVSSPVRRTWESAEILAAVLGLEVQREDGFAEMEFGAWDGLTFAEVAEQHEADLDSWLGSLDHPPGGTGESFRSVQTRVLASLDRLLSARAEQTVVVVSHVTPIKTLVAHALAAPLEAVYHMELAPASVTVVSWFADPPRGVRGSLRLFNARPTEPVFTQH